MANGDVFRLTLECHWALTSITVNNTYWFQQTSATPLAGESQILANDFRDNMVDGTGQFPRFWQGVGYVYDLVRAQRMLFAFEDPTSAAFGPPVQTGGITSMGKPAVCCLVYKLSTGVAGRRHRGRVFLGGFANGGFSSGSGIGDSVADEGRWSSGLISAANGWFTAMLARYNGATVIHAPSGMQARWGIFSRAIGNQTPPFNVAGFQPITSFSTDGIIRIQRRREFGRGV